MTTTTDQKLTQREASQEAYSLGFRHIQTAAGWLHILPWGRFGSMLGVASTFRIEEIDGQAYICENGDGDALGRWPIRKEPLTLEEKCVRLCSAITSAQRARILRQYPGYPAAMLERDARAHYHLGKKYIRIDIGDSGRYMVEADGSIYGIKGYGVIHRGHYFGTLDTIDAWDWGDYYARKVQS